MCYINKLALPCLFEYLESEGTKTNLNIAKIAFKAVQIKFLAVHITNQKLRFNIFTEGNLQNIFMEQYPNNFWHKIKIDNFNPYNIFLAIATNIPVLLKTCFVVQGHNEIKVLVEIPYIFLKLNACFLSH